MSIHVIGALMSQIISQKRDLLSLVESLYNHDLPGPEDIDALWMCIIKSLQEDTDVKIVVDGIDECEDNSDLIRLLCSAIVSLPHVSVILLSRPEESIREQLKQYTSISLTGATISGDLRVYTKSAVHNRIPIESESMKQKIVESLTQKAEGVSSKLSLIFYGLFPF
jgi:hypothetical protein